MRAIGFHMGDRFEELLSGGGKLSLVFKPKINTWQGKRTVELEIVDFQAGADADLA